MNTSKAKNKTKAILDIDGEIEVFCECYNQLKGLSLRDLYKEDRRLHLRIIQETFLLHARNLADFLLGPQKKHDDDIIASDFLLDLDQLNRAVSQDVREAINKQLFHLSYKRVKPKELFDERHKIYLSIKKGLESYNKVTKYKLNLSFFR